MNEKYSNQLVFNYINGLDLDDYDIEELEDDPIFMQKVISVCKDKEMYNLCGDNVKEDYNFIRWLVEFFKDDCQFTISVADDYIKNHDDDSVIELNIIMNNFHYDKFDENCNMHSILKYGLAKQTFILEFMSVILNLYKTDKKAEQDFGLGFMLAYEMYLGYPAIIEELARSYFLEEIFYDKDEKYDFENLIHKNIKDVNLIREQGTINFLINYIKEFDESLSWYISNNLDLIKNISKSLNRTNKNWENYMTDLNMRKTFIFQKELDDYFNENRTDDYEPSFDATELMLYEIEKNNLVSIFSKYSDYAELKSFVLENYSENTINEIVERGCSLIDLKYIKYADNLINELFKEDIISAEPELEQNYKIKNAKAKILKLNFKN